MGISALDCVHIMSYLTIAGVAVSPVHTRSVHARNLSQIGKHPKNARSQTEIGVGLRSQFRRRVDIRLCRCTQSKNVRPRFTNFSFYFILFEYRTQSTSL